MYEVALPISKSIANRILLLQAIHGDPLMRVSADMPDDVVVLHDALEQLREYKKGEPLTLYLKNNGTALRFLQVHLEKCYPGAPITLTGDPRLMERDGAPTTQTTSARILHGEDIPVAENESPYITMSRRIKERYEGAMYDVRRMNEEGKEQGCERDWSAAAFWYEYVAIHGGELLLEGLRAESLQGDRVVADIYAKYFGVKTEFVPEGAVISTKDKVKYEGQMYDVRRNDVRFVSIDFTNCPDLYPAVALTCEHLGITLDATGTERLRYKECDRIEAVQRHEVRNDHRMAMALMAAGAYPLPLPEGKGEELQQIIAKSYPQFIEIFKQVHAESRRSTDGEPTVTTYVTDTPLTHITPIKGVNDDNLGKKHALSKLIHAAQTEYVWLHDDDVIWPEAAKKPNLTFPKGKEHSADLYILPLMMESSLPSGRGGVGSLLQIAEYAAIQELTMRTAKAGRAVMCSGANLIVRREAWLECESELHPEIPSGDDMFLLEAMKRRGMRITVIDEPDYTAVVRPVSTWRSFWLQRMRWAGKAPHYTDKDILRCGALVAAANILQLLFPPVILIKFPIEYSLIKKREPRTLWYVALLLELLYPFYMLISLVGGLLRGKQW
ncbi:MAG: glycosyltransferase [Paludibacteraceae bacterium]|nr:glycosyltransferase [Paludibacteraceae bacterium]MBQ9295815.1 glycosyltransferase [Paludibacteraceae bacterium]